MKIIHIGYASRQYPEQRNIINKVNYANYSLVRDIYSGLRRIRSVTKLAYLIPKQTKDDEFQFLDFNLNRADIIHLFNAVSYSKRPWLSTFETIIPRFNTALKYRETNPDKIRNDPRVLRALDALSSDSCKGIIAISQSAANMQQNFLNLLPEYKVTILDKLQLLHPPQPMICEKPKNNKAYNTNNPISFLFIGHQFFRKGGKEVLHALSYIRKKTNFPITLTIVSNLITDNYATCTTENDVQLIKKYLSDNKDWITHHQSLPYPEVLGLMKQCDIGLLPSYAETYGYSILEFQACGCPVITTDIRSFPEINNNDIGWIIRIPKKTNGEARYREQGGKEKISEAISSGLKNILMDIVDDTESIAIKGQKALNRIRLEHSPGKYGEKLLSIYINALSN
jgi:glycosyltransferase involved in cell wall biosynthesis